MTVVHRLAAPARRNEEDHDQADSAAVRAAVSDFDQLDALFEQWSYWCHTRRYFAPQTSTGNMLGNLSSRGRGFRRPGGPDASCSANMAALHLAILAQPRDALDTQVFLSYYGARAGNIKAAAAQLKISRQHYYRLLKAFCVRVKNGADEIERDNMTQRARLPHAMSIV